MDEFDSPTGTALATPLIDARFIDKLFVNRLGKAEVIAFVESIRELIALTLLALQQRLGIVAKITAPTVVSDHTAVRETACTVRWEAEVIPPISLSLTYRSVRAAGHDHESPKGKGTKP